MPKNTQPKNATGHTQPIVVNMPKVVPKGRSIRFECADGDHSAPISVVYISKAALSQAGITEAQVKGVILSFSFIKGE